MTSSRGQKKSTKLGAKQARGKANKVKNGAKSCAPCGKEHPAAEFPVGKNMCGLAWNAMRNLEACAKRQNHEEWWASVKAHPAKLKKVVAAYSVRVSPEVTGCKRAKKDAFCIASYAEEVRQAEQVLSDGVYEMTNSAAYIAWAAKAENVGLDADEAKLKWEDPRDRVPLAGNKGEGAGRFFLGFPMCAKSCSCLGEACVVAFVTEPCCIPCTVKERFWRGWVQASAF